MPHVHVCMLLFIVSWFDCQFRREALEMWKQKHGHRGTYRKLIKVFKEAGFQGYADLVWRICTDTDGGECMIITLISILLCA